MHPMNFTITPLSQLDPPGLARLAALHQPVMRTLLSDLGQPVVRRYNQIIQQDSSVVGFCAISSSGEAIGWAVGCSHPDEINARLRAPLAWFAGQMLRLAFTRPAILIQLAQAVFSASDVNLLQPGQIELTYIGVAPSARGQGLGKGLLAAFVNTSRIAGYRSVALSVETDNPEAIALYTKAGFKATRTFQEGRFQRYRMELVF
jgi:ribosomal protein S18 acetylase RimI-like enzyme